ncbi:helix-turn-helix domain-containing protein [Laceyella tengchongensis]|uniref:helix-turn-helix domain-containing protein n=1 Tax=Laceyella tengchongensis TaxID=574699 RepID=UPI00188FAE0A
MRKTANNYARLAKKYSLFKNVEHLNGTVRKHLYHKTHLLNKNAIAVYKLLARYAVKFNVTCFLKHETIAEAIGISRRTVIRAINRLIELRIIAKKNVLREQAGGYGSNLYILLPYSSDDTSLLSQRQEPEKPEETTEEAAEPEPETEISKSIVKKAFNKRIASVYENFRHVVYSYIPEKQLLYRLYGVYLYQTRYLKAYSEQELLDAAIYALRTTFNRMRKTKLHNPVGYFNGVLSKTLDRLLEATLRDAYGYYA